MASTSKQAQDKEPLAPKPKRKRARQSDGKYQGGSETWEATEVIQGLPKDIDYSVKKKVQAPTEAKASAGKYSQQDTVTPSFGTVKTILH